VPPVLKVNMTRRRLILWLAIGIPLVAIVLAGSIAYVVLRTLDSTPSTAEAAATAFDEVRRQFPQRPPIIELADLRSGALRVNRAPSSPRKRVETIHFMLWDPEKQEITRGSAPSWITRVRVSLTGIGNWSFSDLHVTLEDVERYAPGIILDMKMPDGQHALAWVPAIDQR
jgi:hypothetical protein